MQFKGKNVFTALNADELQVGSKVIVADTIGELKRKVLNNDETWELNYIYNEEYLFRFGISSEDKEVTVWPLVYLVEEPSEGLRWTDLEVGSIIKNKETGIEMMVIGIDKESPKDYHIAIKHKWLSDEELEKWEKIELWF